MESVFNHFVALLDRINPILIFVLLLTAIFMLFYLRRKLEEFFYTIKTLTIQLKKLNDHLTEEKQNDKY